MKSRKPTESEKGFQQAIIEAARLHGWLVYHSWTAIHSPAGFPDLVLVRPPALIFAEVKTARGKRGEPTEAQRTWLDALARCDVEVYVWRPADWQAIVTRLRLPR